MPSVRCWQVDAFTDRPFQGNPACVCWLESEADPAWMQSVAAEMNLSETAFVRRLTEDLELRWFTPTVEVDLCGHATLATAHALWSSGLMPSDVPLRFHTRSGLLACVSRDSLIELDFPATPAAPIEPPEGLEAALGAKLVHVGRSKFDLMAVFESSEAVRAMRPNFAALARFPARGVIVTAPSDDARFDFQSRFFAPNCGVDEDPVCGSAHCALAPYWSARLGKTGLNAFQASARGGVLRLRHEGNRVVLAGQAVTVWRGDLLC